jgi:hypothetical protein
MPGISEVALTIFIISSPVFGKDMLVVKAILPINN